jgi:putative sterol carrier protein
MTLTIPEIMSKLPSALTPEADRTVEAVVHFKFTGAEPGEWNAVIQAGKCEVAQGIPRTKPSITLSADSSDFSRIASGELDGMQAFMSGRLRISGDMDQAMRVLRMFKMP